MLEEDKGRAAWTKLLLVIPGKQEPKQVGPYFRFLVADLQKYGPSGESFMGMWRCNGQLGW